MKLAGKTLALVVSLGVLLSVPGAALAADDAPNTLAKAKGFTNKVLKGKIEVKNDVDYWKPKPVPKVQWELYKVGGTLVKTGVNLEFCTAGGVPLTGTTVTAGSLFLVISINANDFRVKVTAAKRGKTGTYTLYFRPVPPM